MEKIREYFGQMIVKKSSVQDVFSALSLPSFIRDWFLRRYADNDGEISIDFVVQKIKDILPRKNDWNEILDKILNGLSVKFLAKVNTKIDLKSNIVSFSLPDFGVDFKDTVIHRTVWSNIKDSFLCADADVWGIVELEYEKVQISQNKTEGKISMKSFRDFSPYQTDLEYYKKARQYFSLDEWIDVLLMAIDYNPLGYSTQMQKLFTLTRLLPFVEKRLNLIELAPKGTGKSYVYSQISKKGWLSSGGVMTRAKMFYDMKSKQDGLVSNYDYVAFDEISSIKFPDGAEMQGALKGYLESGAYTVGVKAGSGDAGVVLLGNIRKEQMDASINMFEELPEFFNDSALIDRFHGFVKGWEIPRMSENLKARGWALNTEYFSNIMHLLRDDVCAKSVIDAFIEVPTDADTRDTTAIKRICSAYIKLLFPHWKEEKDVSVDDLDKYCLQPAIEMRKIVKTQLGIMDVEYRNKPMAEYRVKNGDCAIEE